MMDLYWESSYVYLDRYYLCARGNVAGNGVRGYVEPASVEQGEWHVNVYQWDGAKYTLAATLPNKTDAKAYLLALVALEAT